MDLSGMNESEFKNNLVQRLIDNSGGVQRANESLDTANSLLRIICDDLADIIGKLSSLLEKTDTMIGQNNSVIENQKTMISQNDTVIEIGNTVVEKIETLTETNNEGFDGIAANVDGIYDKTSSGFDRLTKLCEECAQSLGDIMNENSSAQLKILNDIEIAIVNAVEALSKG